MRKNGLRFFPFTASIAVMFLTMIIVAAFDPILLKELGARELSTNKNPQPDFQGTSNPDDTHNPWGPVSLDKNPRSEKFKESVDFTLAGANPIELVIGVDNTRPEAYHSLVDIVSKSQGRIVNTVSMDGRVTALVIAAPSNAASFLIRQVESSNLTRYVEPNRKFQVQFIPNDLMWVNQWAPQKIEADHAWDTTVGSHSVLVAVVDTGIDYNHPDLAANYVSGGFDWVNNDTDPMDDNGHGTHCAGIIGAVINNSVGIAGIAQVSIMAEKAINVDGWGDEDDLAKAIVHAVGRGADILSNSWGSYINSMLIQDAVRYAYSKGILVVAAAGNEASMARIYPAAYDEVVAVTATDRFDNPAGFTSFGDWVELAAPGVDILSTYPDNSYGLGSGTSMACPHVAGLAALIWSRFPNATGDWVRARLRFTADDLGVPGFDKYYGYGRINARRAIQETWPDHDLLIFNHEIPKHVHFGSPISFNATILNFGRSKEENIIVELFADGCFAEVTGIMSLALGGTETVSLSWSPLQRGTYNMTLYVHPVIGENFTENNAVAEMVCVIRVRGNVVFEEAHLPLYTIGNNPAGDVPGGYVDFAGYLDANGYNVSTINPGTLICPSSLALADVLVIVAPQVGYSAFELDSIESWVKNGGRLLLISEAQTHGSEARKIAERFNVTLRGDLISEFEHNVGFPTWPYYDGSNIRLHPITAGITRVEMYAGDGIVSVSPGETALIVTHSYGSSRWSFGDYAVNVSVMSAFDRGIAGYGRIVVSTDSNLWDSVYDVDADGDLGFWDSDNELLALNIINWLSARPEHELAVDLDAPSYVEPKTTLRLKATVYNEGLNNETDVKLQLLLNGIIVQNETVHFFINGTRYTFEYSWSPNGETTCNVTVYASPLPSENVTSNNICSRTVRVRLAPKVLSYVEYADYGQEYQNMLRGINSTFGSDYSLTQLWNYTQLDSMLGGKDVLLIPEQEHASPSNMQRIILTWSRTLSEFAENGGIIIICDYSGGTYRILADAGLLSIQGVKNQTGNTLFLDDPQDPLAKKVSPSFVAPNGTACFVFQEAKTFISNGTSPAVIHRKLGQGHIVLLGFDFYSSNIDTEQILGNAMELATPAPNLANEGHGPTQPLIK